MSRYRGRFAPSPSGPLHFGSLVAAVASYLDARAAQGVWLVRIDDIDSPRCKTNAAQNILNTLTLFGMHWDEPLVYQSERLARYAELLQQLVTAQRVYPCSCTRKALQSSGEPGVDGPIYPGTCRKGMQNDVAQYAWRLRVAPETIGFNDAVQGVISQQLAKEVGDCIVRRADGIFAYQLAVVADDADQNITTVVRGKDLLLSTPRQIYLQRLLGFATPNYLHVPLVLDAAGRKLSKSDQAQPLDLDHPIATLNACLSFLGQAPISATTLDAFWPQAIANWSVPSIPA